MKNKKVEQIAKKRKHLERLRSSNKSRRRKDPSITRKRASIDPLPVILIACEGKNTEPSYFNHFKIKSVDIEPIGDGYSHISLIEWTQKLSKLKKYDQIWVVFDADPKPDDSTWKQNFNSAIWKAKSLKYKVGYSHQAFEYWLILHFEAHQGGSMSRKDYNAKINDYIKPLGAVYNGDGDKIISKKFFNILMGIDDASGKKRVELAICRAMNIYNKWDHSNFSKEESSTSVFFLVKELLDMDLPKNKSKSLEKLCR